MSEITVSQLAIYPVKSLRGLYPKSVHLGDTGPRFDRGWMVVDSNNKFLTQRKFPRMCLIETILENGDLALRAPSMDKLKVSPQKAPEVEVIVWKDKIVGQDCGDAVANWLTEFLGIECRLVKKPTSSHRYINPEYAKNNEQVSYADAFPILLASEASLSDFNSKLELCGGSSIEMDRFRPNIVISGCDAYAEDRWRLIRIAGIDFSVVSACSRCIVPSIDPATGIKQAEVIETLNLYRRRDRANYFGQNVIHQGNGNIRVGDKVQLLE